MKNNNNNNKNKESKSLQCNTSNIALHCLLVTKVKRRVCFANAGIAFETVCETFFTAKK